MTELKCPKCGETEEIYDTFNLNGEGCGIKCGNCGYEIKDCESIEEAKFKWKSENDPKALRPCPFCGCQVRYEQDSVGAIGCGWKIIGEHTDDCFLKRLIQIGSGQNVPIVDRWNRRGEE